MGLNSCVAIKRENEFDFHFGIDSRSRRSDVKGKIKAFPEGRPSPVCQDQEGDAKMRSD